MVRLESVAVPFVVGGRKAASLPPSLLAEKRDAEAPLSDSGSSWRCYCGRLDSSSSLCREKIERRCVHSIDVEVAAPSGRDESRSPHHGEMR
jgi:hypothetical protein